MVCLHSDVELALQTLPKNLDEFFSTEPELKQAREIYFLKSMFYYVKVMRGGHFFK